MIFKIHLTKIFFSKKITYINPHTSFWYLTYKSQFFNQTQKYQSFKQVVLKKQEIDKQFVRSSGPGGQSVNKTNSKACIRLKIQACSWIDDYIKPKILQQFKNSINKQGFLIIDSQVHKDQNQNLQQCYKKLQKMIFKCSFIPKQRRYDIPPQTQTQRFNRINDKRRRSQIKSNRRGSRFQ